MIYAPSTAPMRRPTPICAADQALIDIHIAKFGIIKVPRGVSGMTIESNSAINETQHKTPTRATA